MTLFTRFLIFLYNISEAIKTVIAMFFFSGFSFKTLDNIKNLSNYLTPGFVQTEII